MRERRQVVVQLAFLGFAVVGVGVGLLVVALVLRVRLVAVVVALRVATATAWGRASTRRRFRTAFLGWHTALALRVEGDGDDGAAADAVVLERHAGAGPVHRAPRCFHIAAGHHDRDLVFATIEGFAYLGGEVLDGERRFEQDGGVAQVVRVRADVHGGGVRQIQR